MKELKEETVIKTKDEGLGLKSEKECCEDDHIDEHSGLAVHGEKLPASFDNYRNERIHTSCL